MKVLSYNIHKGFTVANRKFVLSHIKAAIKLVGADLVFLQEVLGRDVKHARKKKDWPKVSQFEFLAEEVWPHFAYGKNAVYTTGHHGNAILSHLPISSWENVDISTSSMAKRGLLHGVIELPNKKKLHAICIHLDLFESARKLQAGWLCDRIKEHVPDGEPLIVAGDFNDWRENITKTLKDELGLEETFHKMHGFHARTYPSWFPFFCLDRIYSRGLKMKSAKCLVGEPWNRLSDHAALIAELGGPI